MGSLLLFALAVSAAPSPDLVRLANPYQAHAVRRSLVGAAGRLANADCQRVLTDFRDGAGRTLRENLEVLRETPAGFLGRILFYDGDRLPACDPNRGLQVFAFTSPGSRVVFVCGNRFHERWRRDQRAAEVTLIHEALHALGLGENPPSSEEITGRVAWSCRH